MNIRRTTDYELIAKLNKPVHDLHVKLYPEYFNEYNFNNMRRMFRSLIHNRNFMFMLIEDEGTATGYAWIEFRNNPGNVFNKSYYSIYVHQISIVETKQNKGYGTKLMEEIYRIAKDEGIELVELDYWMKNTVAKDFYKKHGFTRNREFVYKKM
ncbi:GNAT family N-acetyltransferase [Bacillus solimangrovi]|uniref:GNAT family N-acetyltransferase n=1 Tax=Bacillus solimangrovi TaxID=1305675 RepID=A0A1E5LJB2_9BACI|nr:GNAT family N-acetyltransferase [Bacillus solimangrovi]OEH94182.1 GNAT family N-acetyltransferase [Bacillus solimangrovi]